MEYFDVFLFFTFGSRTVAVANANANRNRLVREGGGHSQTTSNFSNPSVTDNTGAENITSHQLFGCVNMR